LGAVLAGVAASKEAQAASAENFVRQDVNLVRCVTIAPSSLGRDR
jgi:hypothetical protein